MTYAINLCPGFDALGAHVLIPAELQEYLRHAFGGFRLHPFDAGQCCERFFDRSGDQPFDFLGR